MDASKMIDNAIGGLVDWRGQTLAEVRRLVLEAVPDAVEEWKWMGTPVWNREGILCLANAHKKVVKVTFPKGASLPDPKKVFNAALEGGKWRAVDFSEGDKIPEAAFKGLVLAALAANAAQPAKRVPVKAAAAEKPSDKTGPVKKAKAKKAPKRPSAK